MKKTNKLFLVVIVLLLAGCGWFGGGANQNVPEEEDIASTPVEPVGPLPPAVVEVLPLGGSELSLNGNVTFLFNQPMDRGSVEGAFLVLPEQTGMFVWADDTTLTFSPLSPWPPDSALTFTINETALAANGLAMQRATSFLYRSTGYLLLTQMIPEGINNQPAVDVDPTSAIVASFNRPVVPLGADLDSLPPGFTIAPAAEGRGEWLNTSTYIFYPQPGLSGGQIYSVTMNAALTSTQGATLQGIQPWTFVTAEPKLVSVSPQVGEANLRLDAEFILTFNQPMNVSSVESALFLLSPTGQRAPGTFTWEDDLTKVTFTPNALMTRDSAYTLFLGGAAEGSGGSPLREDFVGEYFSVGEFEILETKPAMNGTLSTYGTVNFDFNAPVQEGSLEDYITINPAIYFEAYNNGTSISISAFFDPSSEYVVRLSGTLQDKWGDELGDDIVLRFFTASYPPGLVVPTYLGAGTLFVSPTDPIVTAQARNVSGATIRVGAVSPADYIFLKSGAPYDYRNSYRPPNLSEWDISLGSAANRTELVDLPLTSNGGALTPGIYWLDVSPFGVDESNYLHDGFIVASHVNLVAKISGIDYFVWAVDTRTGTAVANVPLIVYDDEGSEIARGQTDAEGVFQTALSADVRSYRSVYTMLGSPGEELFSFASFDWDAGTSAWNFGYFNWYTQPSTSAYVYTDRPIYRPGDTVYFRGVIREAYFGEYELTNQTAVMVKIGGYNSDLASFEAPVSQFGTVQGSYTLPESITPDEYYFINISSLDGETRYGNVTIQVSEYRKPEIDLTVGFEQEEAIAGQSINGLVNSRYFFDAPVSNLDFSWSLYSGPSYFRLPGYQVGPVNAYWSSPRGHHFVDGGSERTTPQGTYDLDLTAEYTEGTRQYTLEVTMTDESGFPISTRDTMTVHPASFYIGVKPSVWVGQAETPIGYEVLVADWDKNPAGARSLNAIFSQVRWVLGKNQFGESVYTSEYTEVDRIEFTTGGDGKFELTFTPPNAGVYQLEVNGGGAVTQSLVWVGGAGQAVWPTRSGGQITLLADAESYQPGVTARVFIPNPFGPGAQALVTIERGQVYEHQILPLDGASLTLPISIKDNYAPNVYVSVTLIGTEANGQTGFRYGLVNLPVDAGAHELNVEVIGQPSQTGPGAVVTFDIRVTDASGSPVQGEFSLAVVDKAIFALTNPNQEPIFGALYDQQPLGVMSAVSLSAAANRYEKAIEGRGGGGGGDEGVSPGLRDNFEDTAFWSGVVVTDSSGIAQVQVTLPDNLTTWNVLVRGLTVDTKVGEAEIEIITTKELLIRPVTPRFFVAGDHAQIAAVVHNNSGNDLTVNTAVLFEGFRLDDASTAIQTVNIPAGGRARLEWWGTVEDVEAVKLIFSVDGGGLEDLTTPANGDIPVLHYASPQTFATAGVLDQPGEILEVISLPRSFDPAGGGLRVDIAPSLAAPMLESLRVLEEYGYTNNEYIASRMIANLDAYQALQQAGLNDPELAARLDEAVVGSINKLYQNHNFDGGWGWIEGGESDPYVTAYILLGLIRAREAGFEVVEWTYDETTNYLAEYFFAGLNLWTEPWQLNRAVFVQYALTRANVQLIDQAYYLYDQRSQLDPWAQALLGSIWQTLSPGDARAQTLFSDLQGKAIRSSTGVHWEGAAPDLRNMSNAITNTSIVTYALTQYDPGSTLIPDAVRYLMAHRDVFGAWASPYATAWSVRALSEVMKVSGELQGNYAFTVSLNNVELTSGQAGGIENIQLVQTNTKINALFPDLPNQLLIGRGEGEGRLYYSAYLQVYQPVRDTAPLERGLTVSRAYYLAGEDCVSTVCTPLKSAPVGSRLTVRVTVTIPNDVYYLVVEDHIPAGSEIVNLNLKTSQQYYDEPEPQFDSRDPFGGGWGWWLFGSPAIYDEQITWEANFVSAGTYELTYSIVLLQPGEYQVIPARAWQMYFPEVQGTSGGAVLGILP